MRSSFDPRQSAMLLSGHSDKILFSKIIGERMYTAFIRYTAFISEQGQPFSLLVYHDSETDDYHKFLHHNYTMFRCLWNPNMTMYDKVDIFRDMSSWLLSNNETLKAGFVETDDYLAWNIATYNEEGGEHHFD